MQKDYDFLIVGSGLAGSVFARIAADKGKKVLVIDKRPVVGGNVRTENMEGINVHMYGPHIFHTNDEKVWSFVNQFASFNRFTYSPMADYKGKLYNLPFNMNTFYQLWGCTSPDQAKVFIDMQAAGYDKPKNLEEAAIGMVGTDIYEKLIKGYTQKQWNRSCKDLPAFIIKRLPVRFSFDNNYFDDRYQGIPEGGYTKMIERLLSGVEVRTGIDFLKDPAYWMDQAELVLYSGAIDEFYNYDLGRLEYRSLRFEHEVFDVSNFQGCAVVNYTDYRVPYTRTIEHKFFEFGTQKQTVLTREFPQNWSPGEERYYPVNDRANNELYLRYQRRAMNDTKIRFIGRLGRYKYYNMDQVIASSLKIAAELT